MKNNIKIYFLDFYYEKLYTYCKFWFYTSFNRCMKKPQNEHVLKKIALFIIFMGKLMCSWMRKKYVSYFEQIDSKIISFGIKKKKSML